MERLYTKQLVPALLIFLFTYTAGNKLAEFDFFRAQLSIYPFIKEAAPLLAVVIPLAELCVAGCLLVPATRKVGLYASSLLLICFTVYLCVMVATESNLPCSCGGVISSLTWQQHILFNLVFIILSLVGVRLERRKAEEPQSTLNSPAGFRLKRTAQRS